MKVYLRYISSLYFLVNICIFSGSAYADKDSKKIGAKDLMGYCGDGIINGNEQCDGDAISVASCRALGGGEGTVKCQRSCVFDISGCFSPTIISPPSFIGGTPREVKEGYCGDGIINGNEDCDSYAIMNTSCSDYGAGEGHVTCQPNCLYDMSGCSLHQADPIEVCRFLGSEENCKGGCVETASPGQSQCRYTCDQNNFSFCDGTIKSNLERCDFRCDCGVDVTGKPDCNCRLEDCMTTNSLLLDSSDGMSVLAH